MRGGAQAQLLLASDYHFYIVKFQNNPQHRRVLANELLAYVLLRHLQLPTPVCEVIQVSEELTRSCPNLYIEGHGQRIPCSHGLQFGSRYPGSPLKVPVYDYVPDFMLRKVVNADSFLGMVAFDKWVANADGRQAIFFRDRIAQWRPAAEAGDPAKRGFVALMVDQGFSFTAQHWEFRDTPQSGFYPRYWLYERVKGFDAFEPWLGRITEFCLDVLDDAFKRIPPEWYDGDIAALERLLEQLYARRKLVPDLLRAAKRGIRDPFPNWN